MKIGDKVIVGKASKGSIKHYIIPGSTCVITKIFDNHIVVEGPHNNSNKTISQAVSFKDVKIINNNKNSNNMSTQFNQLMKTEVLKAAQTLAKANNTFTTLELKVKLRKEVPNFYWTQATVSSIMDELAKEGKFNYKDNGTYRIYSDPTVKIANKPVAKSTVAVKKVTTSKTLNMANAKKISRKKALELMENSKGRFFTVEFVKQDGSLRLLNGQYVKDQKKSALGYILMKESSKLKANVKEPIRNVNIQTLKALKISGQVYKVN